MEVQLFEISFLSFNLFSFMLGATWAFFNQGLFGKKIGIWVIGYFALLAVWYGAKANMESQAKTKVQSEPVKIEQTAPTPQPKTPANNQEELDRKRVDEYFMRQG